MRCLLFVLAILIVAFAQDPAPDTQPAPSTNDQPSPDIQPGEVPAPNMPPPSPDVSPSPDEPAQVPAPDVPPPSPDMPPEMPPSPVPSPDMPPEMPPAPNVQPEPSPVTPPSPVPSPDMPPSPGVVPSPVPSPDMPPEMPPAPNVQPEPSPNMPPSPDMPPSPGAQPEPLPTPPAPSPLPPPVPAPVSRVICRFTIDSALCTNTSENNDNIITGCYSTFEGAFHEAEKFECDILNATVRGDFFNNETDPIIVNISTTVGKVYLNGKDCSQVIILFYPTFSTVTFDSFKFYLIISEMSGGSVSLVNCNVTEDLDFKGGRTGKFEFKNGRARRMFNVRSMSEITISDSEFTRHGVSLQETRKLTISNSIFRNATGEMTISTSCNTQISDCIFADNSYESRYSGVSGALTFSTRDDALCQKTSILVQRTKFENNTLRSNKGDPIGPAVLLPFLYNYNVVFDTCYFRCNLANESLGAPPVAKYKDVIGYDQFITFKNSINSPDCPWFCQPGSYSDSGLLMCTTCYAGSSANSTMATSCTNCSIGSVAKIGSATCTVCGNGTYADLIFNSCMNCSAGSYSVGGVTTCPLCPKKTYQPSSAQSECLPCEYSSSEGEKVCNSPEQCGFFYQGKYCADLSGGAYGIIGGIVGAVILVGVIVTVIIQRNRSSQTNKYQLLDQQ